MPFYLLDRFSCSCWQRQQSLIRIKRQHPVRRHWSRSLPDCLHACPGYDHEPDGGEREESPQPTLLLRPVFADFAERKRHIIIQTPHRAQFAPTEHAVRFFTKPISSMRQPLSSQEWSRPQSATCTLHIKSVVSMCINSILLAGSVTRHKPEKCLSRW